MTLRTTSKPWQWAAWLGTGLAALTAYVVLSRLLYGTVVWSMLDLRAHRLALPIAVVWGLLTWETRWDGVRRKMVKVNKGQGNGSGTRVEVAIETEGRNSLSEMRRSEVEVRLPQTTAKPTARVRANDLRQGQDEVEKVGGGGQSDALRHVLSQPSTSNSSLTGEALFDQARALRHRKIPDFNMDAKYLDLLGRSAQKGHAPALAKLGEYAMRRAAWVEAYYWMSMAKRQGMPNLVNAMRKIRMYWAQDGFPRQSSVVNKLFTAEAGSIGRALLHVDSGHEAAKAKEFLKANYPEFLT